jgi:hypothetical protein
MWMKAFKGTVLVWGMVILSVSMALGAPKDSALVGGGGQKGDAALEREIEGGIKITLQEVFKKDSYVWIRYTLLSEEDVIVKIEVEKDNGTLFDDRGNQFTAYNGNVEIGNQSAREREIIGGVPTAIFVGYSAGQQYVMPEKFPRVAVNVNGKKMIFRDVPNKQ